MLFISLLLLLQQAGRKGGISLASNRLGRRQTMNTSVETSGRSLTADPGWDMMPNSDGRWAARQALDEELPHGRDGTATKQLPEL